MTLFGPVKWVKDKMATSSSMDSLADLGGARPACAPHLPGILVHWRI